MNCGIHGHNYRSCIAPITSYGMIIFRVKGGWNQSKELVQNMSSISGLEHSVQNIQYLLIQRKDSLGFVDIMRGKYKVDDVDYIMNQQQVATDMLQYTKKTSHSINFLH